MIINSVEKTWRITKEAIEALPISNHEEVDKKLIFYARMTNEAVVIAGKDAEIFLLLIYALSQLERFLPPWCMGIDSSQFNDINMLYDNSGSVISDFPPQPHAITGCDITPYKFNVGKVHAFEKDCKYPSSLTLI